MNFRAVRCTVIVAALALPAAGLAEGILAHSSYYSEHAKFTKPENNVSMVINRKTGRADVYVANFCLGSMYGSPMQAQTRSGHEHNGTLSFDGKADVYNQKGQTTVAMKLSATVTSKKVSGKVKFPDTAACKTISFDAKLVQATK